MEQFIFKGDWEFDLQLSMFMASNSNWGDHKRKTPELKPIRVVIKDEKNYDPDPIEEQIATVHYIMKNQMAVLNGLCSALDRINQQYAEWCGEDDWFPDKMSIATISDVLWISEITILTEHKDGRAYYEISCEYRGDLEHGLIIVMYDTRMLEHAPVGEVEYSELYKDLGELSAAQIEKNLQSNDFGLNQIHIPLPKYGKLKPWQEEAMSDYLSNLVRLKNNELLKEMINDDKFDINQRLDYKNRNLVDMAAYYGNTEMIEFLVERKADTSRSILECTSHYNEIKKDAIEILVKNGAYIDTLNYMGVTPMYSAMLNYARNLSRMIDYKEKDENRYNKAKEDVENYKDMLQFFVSKGANPLSMNKQGDDFRAILKTQIGRTALTKHAIVEKVEEFFYPNPTKKNPTPEQDTSNSEKKYPKWQFWRRF